MNEYIIALEQIQELIERSAIEAIDGYRMGVAKQIWSFPKLPEIVRCRNCIYCDDRAAQEWDEYLAEQYGDPPCCCDSPQWDGPYLHRLVRPNGFCAWGERRDE